jgi:hypothetical protein
MHLALPAALLTILLTWEEKLRCVFKSLINLHGCAILIQPHMHCLTCMATTALHGWNAVKKPNKQTNKQTTRETRIYLLSVKFLTNAACRHCEMTEILDLLVV